jgi:hypothetical protein
VVSPFSEDPRCFCGLPDLEALLLGGFDDLVHPISHCASLRLILARTFRKKHLSRKELLGWSDIVTRPSNLPDAKG